MPRMRFELDVEMEDGSTFSVVADQRDIAKFEVQDFGWPIAQIEEKVSTGFLRFLAWSAATRQQLTNLPWLEFDAKCVEAIPPDEEGKGKDSDDADDPGHKARSDKLS